MEMALDMTLKEAAYQSSGRWGLGPEYLGRLGFVAPEAMRINALSYLTALVGHGGLWIYAWVTISTLLAIGWLTVASRPADAGASLMPAWLLVAANQYLALTLFLTWRIVGYTHPPAFVAGAGTGMEMLVLAYLIFPEESLAGEPAPEGRPSPGTASGPAAGPPSPKPPKREETQMRQPLDDAALDRLFRSARTYNKFEAAEVTDEVVGRLYELLKWGPTAVNCQSGRYVFVRSKEAKERLTPCLAPGNVAKVQAAPVTVIVATDPLFYEKLPTQWTAYDARQAFVDDPAMAESGGFRNSSLQGAYLILAARSLGLDCGPMSGFDNAKVDTEFFRESGWRSNFLINLGYGLSDGYYPRGPRLAFEEVARIL
jgi:nitroreductase